MYASPAQGYAQIALAHACADHGKRATVFVAERKSPHARTAAAQSAGARIEQVPHGYLANVQAKAAEYCRRSGAKLLPFGCDCEEMLEGIAQAARESGAKPTEVWCSAGSGTLTRALQRAFRGVPHYAVRVGASPNCGTASVIIAPEKYERDARHPPPFPSCGNYDAKVWQFFRDRAKPGALYWNVGA